MKIAVYTIALNEEQFVEAWYNSAHEADFLLIADTGSTDDTIEIAESLGIHVIQIAVKPWRFDLPRNAALAALPADIDYCIALDMDEVLTPGWREELEKLDPANVTRPRYKYTWSWNEDGTPGLEYGGDKIHARYGYRWKHPVHEVLLPYSIQETQAWTELCIEHHPDSSKSRSQYFPLLELAVSEDPTDDRNAHYLAREYFFHGMLDQAAAEFKRHLSLPRAVWAPERAQSMRYLAKCEPDNAVVWLTNALAESYRRECLVDLAKYWFELGDWRKCLDNCLLAIGIVDKPLDYLCEAEAWGSLPYDMGAVSAYYLGDKALALEWGQKALELNPGDKRLESNLQWYRGTPNQ